MKKSIITLFLAAVSVMSCEPPMPPSDEEMIRHFATHEAAFRKVYEIMSESSEGSFHYPPLSPEEVITPSKNIFIRSPGVVAGDSNLYR